MMFSVKLFTIVSAVLAVAVNGSPAGLAEGGLQARDDQEPLGTVRYCTSSSGCNESVTIYENPTCFYTGDTMVSFSHTSAIVCTGYTDAGCTTGSASLKDIEYDNIGRFNLFSFYCKAGYSH